MTSASIRWTTAGLLIALFGVPAIAVAFHAGFAQPSDAIIAARELLILALTGLLLWIVIRRERLPLSSIGLRFERAGRSVAWGIALTLCIFAAVIAMLAAYGALGVRYGEDGRIAPSLGVTLLTVLRAGISEEIFYRGFALERLEQWSGSKWIASAIVVGGFAAFHFRQGWPGMLLALVLGAILTGFYLWKRDLLAAIIAHFLVDFVPNVAVPLLGGDG
jgi:membrane protease YdiL (CAAX protease family)